ncbi:MAG: HD domain-containing protein [Clostridiales bacterium]|nr:HD domain-containing protein [Clostridiales bacterium]
MIKLDSLALEMTRFYSGDPARIQHFMKVHAYSALIGRLEGLGEREMLVLECAAYTHDIGIKPAEEKYNSCSGKLQELEGPPVAREMLTQLGFDGELTERVCAMIAHHHTYTGIDTRELQILIEADFIVNLYEGKSSREAIADAIDNIFKTESGIALIRSVFGN